MNVAEARHRIQNIERTIEEINEFDRAHEELLESTGFLCDAAAYLGDYKKTLEKAIESAELVTI